MSSSPTRSAPALYGDPGTTLLSRREAGILARFRARVGGVPSAAGDAAAARGMFAMI